MWKQLRKIAETYYNAERTIGDIKEGPSLGTFLTDDINAARMYAGSTGRIREVQPNIKNPLIIKPVSQDPYYRDWFTTEDVNKVLADAGVAYIFNFDDDDEFYRFLDVGGINLVKAIKEAGYDALVYPENNFNTTLVFEKVK